MVSLQVLGEAHVRPVPSPVGSGRGRRGWRDCERNDSEGSWRRGRGESRGRGN